MKERFCLVLFVCKVEGCSKHFPKYAGFTRHVHRNHNFVKYNIETNYKELQKGGTVKCCSNNFMAYDAYKNHVNNILKIT